MVQRHMLVKYRMGYPVNSKEGMGGEHYAFYDKLTFVGRGER